MKNAVVIRQAQGEAFVTRGDCAVITKAAAPCVRLVSDNGSAVILAGQRGAQGEQGPIGPAGGSALAMITAQALSGERIVYAVDASTVNYASCSDIAHFSQVLGLTETAAASGASVNVRRSGEFTFEGWSWIQGPVFLGENGALTQTVPSTARFSLAIGFAMSATTLFIDIGTPIILES